MDDSTADLLRPATALDELCINTIRFLAVDAVEKAKSGHPGLPMGSAAMAFTLWDRFLRFNPRDPGWPDRDRYVLSAGHGCMLQYALLHLTGYDLPLDEIKNFRQYGSITPGHPEFGKTPGIEATTGPLGQGIGNAVGMAMAEAALAARFNRPGHSIIDHYIYVETGDGDLMEGISSEAASLAGHHRLGKLIVMYSNNHISIEGSTGIAFTEDVMTRFTAFGWHVLSVEDGNDMASTASAIVAARAEKTRPSFISVTTHIGYGSPHKQDDASAHGEPLGAQEVKLAKDRLGWPREPEFLIPPEALAHFRLAIERGAALQADWEARFSAYAKAYPELAAEFERVIEGRLPPDWDADIPVFPAGSGSIATRNASGKVLNAIARRVPELMGGSADLSPSTKTIIDGAGDFQPETPAAPNMHFGVREHGMGSVLNGIAYHGGFIPYGATFLIFSDYMRPPMRLAALGDLHVIYVFTHDSIGLGEDGPTHQAVEQLLGLRAVPNMVVIRPADANETSAAWRVAVAHGHGPVALALTRQNLPVLDPERFPNIAAGVAKGAYVLSDVPSGGIAELILVATGSEVHLALAAGNKLSSEGFRVRVVSMPSWNLLAAQPAQYRREIFPPGIPLLALEAGVSLGWQPYIDRDCSIDVVGVDRFGASAPGDRVMREYGFSVENVTERARRLIAKQKGD